MKWDRKKKRFTSGDQVGADNKKLIRSESGALLPASYNSGRYKEWKQAHRKAANTQSLSGDKATPDNGILPARSIYRNRKEKEKVGFIAKCHADHSEVAKNREASTSYIERISFSSRKYACRILLDIRENYLNDVSHSAPCPPKSVEPVGSAGSADDERRTYRSHGQTYLKST